MTLCAFLVITYLSIHVLDEVIHKKSRKFHVTQIVDIEKFEYEEFYRKLDIFIQMRIDFNNPLTRPDLNRSECFNDAFHCRLILFP